MSTTAGTARHVGGLSWDFTRWTFRHWFGLAFGLAVVPALWVILERPDLAVLVAVVWWVVPGLVCTVWARFWPFSWHRLVAGPLQRWGWRKWARDNWADIARQCDLSTSYEVSVRNWWNGTTSQQTRWKSPRLRKVSTSDYVMDLAVDARRGQTSRDITAQAEAIGAAANAVSATGRKQSPSRAVISVVMVDNLTGEVASPEPVPGKHGAVVVGRYASGLPVAWDPLRCLSMAIQGMTRSGKSALCYGYLGAVAHRPDVIVCGIDKTGVLLTPFANGRGASWTVTSAKDGPKVAAVLDSIVDFTNDRIEGFLARGKDKLNTFDAATPVVLVVLEEYPGLIKQLRKQDSAEGRAVKDRVAPKVEAAVGIIAAEGAKAGVVTMVLAQRMSSESIDTDTRANLPIRATLRVDKLDAVRMLHDKAETEQVEDVLEASAGRVLYQAPNVPLQQFQASSTDYETYTARVARGLKEVPVAGAFRTPPVEVPQPAEPSGKGKSKSGAPS
ncbi:MAG: hypothetical protein WA991_05870 [Ornithinimicrobium sp.]